MENNKGKLFIITGPSGVGKGTILNKFFEKNRKNIVCSVSTTTRNPRPNEQEGVNYFYVSKEDFEKSIENEEFLEWARYSENYYGTKKEYVLKKLNQGFDVVLEIEAQGARQVMEKFGECISIFITPPNLDELEKRLRGRKTESEEAIEKRLDAVKTEMAQKKYFKHTITNDEIERAYLELQEIYESEKR